MRTVKATAGVSRREADMRNRMKPSPSPYGLLTMLVAGWAAVLATGCASTGAVPRPFPVPGRAEAPPPATPRPADIDPASPESPAPATGGDAIARTALGLRGIPYRLGGSDLEGFDCSGLVQYVLAQHGVTVPRIVDDQVELGREIDDEEIRPGDLIFFAVDSRKPSHVGIAIGREQFVHAPRTGQRVRVDALSSPYWRERYKEARRLDSLSSGGAMLTLGDEAP